MACSATCNLVRRKDLGETPEDIILTDVALIIAIVLWLATAGGRPHRISRMSRIADFSCGTLPALSANGRPRRGTP